MEIERSFVLSYRRMIQSADFTPEVSARQLALILRRVRCARRGPPLTPTERDEKLEETEHGE